MNKELVETITRLVLERINSIDNPNVKPLSNIEIKEWNSLRLSKQSDTMSPKSDEQYLQPLSAEEIVNWARVAPTDPVSSNLTGCKEREPSSDRVKFTKYY